MKNVERIKELGRLASIYTIGNVLVSFLGFVLYPIYTQYLTPSQFGIIGLAILVSGGVQHVFSLGTRGAAFNFYHRYEGRDRKELYTSLFVFTLLFGSLVVILMEVIGPGLFRWLLGEDLYHPYLRIAIYSSAVIAIFKTIPEQKLKAAENARGAVLLDIGQGVVNHTATLIGIVVLSLGAVGYLLGTLLGAVAVGVVGTVYLLRTSVRSVSLSKIKASLVYSLPLFPHHYSHFIISMADRVLLSQLATLSAVGVYTLGYALSKALQIAISAGNNAIMPEFAAASGDNEAYERLPGVATYYVLAAGLFSVGFSLFMPIMVELLFPRSYSNAISIIPWLAASFFCLALYYVPMNVLAQTQRETKYVPLLTAIAAVSNLILNYFLIPIYGIVGAAASTFAAYLLLAFTVFIISQRIRSINYEYKRLGAVIIALLVVIPVGTIIPDESVSGIVVRSILLGLFGFIILGLGFLSDGEKAILIEQGQRFRDSLDRI